LKATTIVRATESPESVVLRHDRYTSVARVLFRVLLLNLAVAIAKIAFGYASGAISILSDGFHSLTDAASNVAGLVGVHAARQPPDEDHPYGHRKYETVAAAAVTVFLLLLVIEVLRNAFNHLTGRIEHMAMYGALFTDFNLIKAGALHRANGGYLILDARKVLLQPYAWEEVKRALRSRDIRIESLAENLGWSTTVTLQPQTIPLSVKIVLIGDRMLYYMLSQADPDFAELFKVEKGLLHEIEAILERAPYGMTSGWSSWEDGMSDKIQFAR